MLDLKLNKFNFFWGLFIISFEALSQSTNQISSKKLDPKAQLSEACHREFSGSTVQIDSCNLCAKRASDINSNSFNKCMSNYDDLYRLENGQDSLDGLMIKPGCLKGVKTFGC